MLFALINQSDANYQQTGYPISHIRDFVLRGYSSTFKEIIESCPGAPGKICFAFSSEFTNEDDVLVGSHLAPVPKFWDSQSRKSISRKDRNLALPFWASAGVRKSHRVHSALFICI